MGDLICEWNRRYSGEGTQAEFIDELAIDDNGYGCGKSGYV